MAGAFEGAMGVGPAAGGQVIFLVIAIALVLLFHWGEVGPFVLRVSLPGFSQVCVERGKAIHGPRPD